MAMKDSKQNMDMSEKLKEQYKLGDACENAFAAYRRRLDPDTRSYLRADTELYEAIANAFYGASSQEELDALMGKTPDELASIGKGGGKNGGQA